MEQQPPPAPCNTPGIDKGKKPAAGEGKDAEGFVQVKARNRNRGQKRTLMERQDDDTFNRFEVLDELGQQEVNPGLINAEQLVADSGLEICSPFPPSASHVESAMPMVMDG